MRFLILVASSFEARISTSSSLAISSILAAHTMCFTWSKLSRFFNFKTWMLSRPENFLMLLPVKSIYNRENCCPSKQAIGRELAAASIFIVPSSVIHRRSVSCSVHRHRSHSSGRSSGKVADSLASNARMNYAVIVLAFWSQCMLSNNNGDKPLHRVITFLS